MKRLEQIAYEAYATNTGGKTFDGRKMPSWADLPERIRAAWKAAIEAAGEAMFPPKDPKRGVLEFTLFYDGKRYGIGHEFEWSQQLECVEGAQVCQKAIVMTHRSLLAGTHPSQDPAKEPS